MKRLPNHNEQLGLTFVEVMLAIFMLGFLLTGLLVTQDTIFVRINYYSSALRSLFLLKEKLHRSTVSLEEKKSKGPKENAPLVITYEKQPPPEKSSLKKFDDLILEKVSGKWTDIRGKHQETLINIVYSPEKKTS